MDTKDNPTVNYWAIMDELMKTQEPTRRTALAARMYGVDVPSAVLVQEFSTIGFTVPHQWGKTQFVAEFLDRYPTALGVVVHEDYRTRLTERCTADVGNRIMIPTEFKGGEFAEQLVERPIWEARIAPFEYVIVDDARYVYNHLPRNWLLHLLARKPGITLIEIN